MPMLLRGCGRPTTSGLHRRLRPSRRRRWRPATATATTAARVVPDDADITSLSVNHRMLTPVVVVVEHDDDD